MTAQPEPTREAEPDDARARAFADYVAALQRGEAPPAPAQFAELARLARDVGAPWQATAPVLPGYRLLRPIGRGSAGVVWLARQERLQREVAIKVLPTAGLPLAAQQRCREEAQLLARFRDPRVVVVHDVLEHDGVIAITMDYVSGPDLRAVCRDLQTAPDRPAAAIARERIGPHFRGSWTQWVVAQGIRLAGALAALHTQGLVHRDVKPENVLLDADGDTVLVDLGLALPPTADGAFVGTRAYAAPEQRRGDVVDGRTDVFALALVLVELLTRQRPNTDRTNERPLGRRFGLGRDLSAVLERALEADPARRYPDAAAFAADLERASSMQPVHALPHGPLRRLAASARRHRRALAAWATGVIAVVGATFAATMWLRTAEGAPRAAAAAQRHAHELLLASAVLPGDEAGTEERASLLREALRAYDQALTHEPTSERRTERALLAFAADLLDARAGAYSGALVTAIDSTMARSGGGLPEPVRRAGRDWLRTERIWLPRTRGSAVPPAFEIGLLALALGDLAPTGHDWSQLSSQGDPPPLVLAVTGLMLHESGQFGLALPRLLRGAVAFPNATVLAVRLADVALALGDTGLARSVLEQCPSVPRELQAERDTVLAGLLAADGHTEAAAAAFAAAAPDDASPLLVQRHGEFLLQSGSYGAAARLLRSAHDRHPRHAGLHSTAARACLAAGDLTGYLHLAIEAEVLLSNGSAGAGAPLLRTVLQYGGEPPSIAPDAREGQGLPPTLATLLAARPDHEMLGELVRRCARWHRSRWTLPEGPEGRVAACFEAFATAGLTAPELLLQLPHGPTMLLAAAALQRHRSWCCRDALPRLWLAAERVLSPGPSPGPVRTVATPEALAIAACALSTNRDGEAVAVILGGEAPEVGMDARRFMVTPLGSGVEVRWHLRGRGNETYDLPVGEAIWSTNASLRAIGDLDGDGRPELAVAIAGLERSVANSTPSHVSVYGRGSEPIWRRPAPGASRFPWSLARHGDVDGDGCIDLLVGWPSAMQPLVAGPDVEIVSGRTGEVLRSWSGPPLRVSGTSVVGLPDLDGDGVPEFAVGCPHRRRGAGSVVVVSGRDLRSIGEWPGPANAPAFGSRILCGDDVDGDGWPELLVGDAQVASGGAIRTSVWSISSRDGSLHWVSSSPQMRSQFGASAVRVRDHDGDGHGDFLVGAPLGGVGRRGEVSLLSASTGAILTRWTIDAMDARFGFELMTLPDERGPALGWAAAFLGERRGVAFHPLVPPDRR